MSQISVFHSNNLGYSNTLNTEIYEILAVRITIVRLRAFLCRQMFVLLQMEIIKQVEGHQTDNR